jgi:GntR family transcriptional regulator, transcriptional repressor for pyruvate dehydrogenase complex
VTETGTVVALWSKSVYSPVPVRNAFEVTVDRLATAIKLGVLVAGEQLPPERDLAEVFGVSRVTLREAIKALREVGLVESRRGRGGGTFVCVPKARRRRGPRQIGRAMGELLQDALDMRRVVEPGAAELAASRTLSREDREALRVCLAEATRASEKGRRLADSRLHMAIAAATGSPTVAAAVGNVQVRLDELLRAIPVLPANITHSDKQHARIVAAVLGGDPEAARLAMAEHVEGTSALLHGLLG